MSSISKLRFSCVFEIEESKSISCFLEWKGSFYTFLIDMHAVVTEDKFKSNVGPIFND